MFNETTSDKQYNKPFCSISDNKQENPLSSFSDNNPANSVNKTATQMFPPPYTRVRSLDRLPNPTDIHLESTENESTQMLPTLHMRVRSLDRLSKLTDGAPSNYYKKELPRTYSPVRSDDAVPKLAGNLTDRPNQTDFLHPELFPELQCPITLADAEIDLKVFGISIPENFVSIPIFIGSITDR